MGTTSIIGRNCLGCTPTCKGLRLKNTRTKDRPMLLLLIWKIGIYTFQFFSLQNREKLLLFLLIITVQRKSFLSPVLKLLEGLMERKVTYYFLAKNSNFVVPSHWIMLKHL